MQLNLPAKPFSMVTNLLLLTPVTPLATIVSAASIDDISNVSTIFTAPYAPFAPPPPNICCNWYPDTPSTLFTPFVYPSDFVYIRRLILLLPHRLYPTPGLLSVSDSSESSTKPNTSLFTSPEYVVWKR